MLCLLGHLVSTPWACKLNSKFNRKVTKYLLSALKSLASKRVLWCGWGKKKTTLICSRNGIWESIHDICCLNLSSLSFSLDLSCCALEPIRITTCHAASDVPFPKVLTLEKREPGCVSTAEQSPSSFNFLTKQPGVFSDRTSGVTERVQKLFKGYFLTERSH